MTYGEWEKQESYIYCLEEENEKLKKENEELKEQIKVLTESYDDLYAEKEGWVN